jgi:hypothetical protein
MAKARSALITASCAGCLAVATGAGDRDNAPAAGAVTVVYRGQTDGFTGRDAENLSKTRVVDTPYFAVTDAGGRFRIRGVPEGSYDVTVWDEAVDRLPKESGPVRLPAAERGEYTLTYQVPLRPADRQ